MVKLTGTEEPNRGSKLYSSTIDTFVSSHYKSEEIKIKFQIAYRTNRRKIQIIKIKFSIFLHSNHNFSLPEKKVEEV